MHARTPQPEEGDIRMRLDPYDELERDNIRAGVFKVDSDRVGAVGEDFLRKVCGNQKYVDLLLAVVIAHKYDAHGTCGQGGWETCTFVEQKRYHGTTHLHEWVKHDWLLTGLGEYRYGVNPAQAATSIRL